MLIPTPHISPTHACHTYTDLSGSESPTDTPTTVGYGSTPPDETQSSSPPAAKRPALSSTQDCGDVASFVVARIANADQRYNLLNNHFKPGADYSFPKHANGHSFQF